MKSVYKDFVIKLLLVTLAGFIVFNFGFVAGVFHSLMDILQPIFIGMVFALILNAPMEYFETKLFRKIKKQKNRFSLSLILSVTLLLGIIALILGLILPAGIKSIQGLIAQVNGGTAFDALADGNPFFDFLLTEGKKLYDKMIGEIKDYMPKMMNIAQNILKVVINLLMGIFIAIMMVANRDNLKEQVLKFLHFSTKRPKFASIIKITDIALKKFSRYLAGQLTEALLLGAVCYMFMIILNLPYAALISLIIGFVNLIPIIGAYVGGAFSAILIFALSPVKALIFIIFIIILQQLEAFTTYPIIVGKYVGLNSFWIIVSVIVWGGIFGFWGVFLGVPLTAFLQEVISQYIKEKNKLKELSKINKEIWQPDSPDRNKLN